VNQKEQQQQFGQWVQEHGAILHHVVNGFASGHDRNDLMQELLLALWKAVPAFRRDAQPSTFIYRVSHNAAMTWQRTQRNYRRRVEQFEALIPAETSVDDSASGAERLERLYAEIRRLAPLDRSLILLSLDGVSYRGMAAIHGLSESNVGVRLTRLKQKLATAMKEVCHEP
jgi:RNA polymerase sigma factor (sigma-70 family)